MLAFADYVASDALEWAARVRRKEICARELLECAIARAEAVNPRINAIAFRCYEKAYDRAALASEGVFAGVPWAMKDLFQTIQDVPLTNGSRTYAGYVGRDDSELVKRYKAAGLNIFCTSTAPEFGVSATTESTLYGKTRNPWDLTRTSGGSSGGASALVAAGVLPAAHATDGGGSIRGPASCCGLVGLKPSRGRVPVAPTRTEGWYGCSTTHAVTRSIRDSAILLDATHGPEPGSRYIAPPARGRFIDAAQRSPKPLRIAFHCKTRVGIIVDPECVCALESAARLCEELGHCVEPAAPRIDLDRLATAFGCAVLTAIAQLALARAKERGTDSVLQELEQTNREYIEMAKQMSASQLMSANDAFMSAALAVSRFQETYDLILTPTMGCPAVSLGTASLMQPADDYDRATERFSCFTSLYNQTGQPAISVPLHWTAQGLPVGVQFAARLGEEELLLSFGAQLEQARPWFNRRPSV